MNNGDPKAARIIKLVNTEWSKQTAKAFLEDIKLRASSGVFNTKGGVFTQNPVPYLPESNTMCPALPMPTYAYRNSNPNSNYNNQPTPYNQGCFNCGDMSHWKSDCPQRRGYRSRRGGYQHNRGGRWRRDTQFQGNREPRPQENPQKLNLEYKWIGQAIITPNTKPLAILLGDDRVFRRR